MGFGYGGKCKKGPDLLTILVVLFILIPLLTDPCFRLFGTEEE